MPTPSQPRQERPRSFKTENLREAHRTYSSLMRDAQDTVIDPTDRLAPIPVPPPMQIGQYQLVRELGRGGMGVVYAATCTRLARRVALKVIQLGPYATDVEVARFRVEARSSARLGHPNIVSVHDAGSEQGAHYLVMDLIEGESLATRLKSEGALETHEAASVTEQLALALQHAHTNNVLHRDVKPGNVLFARTGKPLLTDFGLAKDLASIEPELTETGDILGTPAYMSPEQADGKSGSVGPRADVYSLGATLYHMLTGEPPFGGRSWLSVMDAVMHEEAPSPSRLRPSLDPDLETLCLKCLEKDPARRYNTAQELADDLGRYLRQEPILARRPTLQDRLQKWVRRETKLARVLAASALLLLLGSTVSAAWINRLADQEHKARSLLGEVESLRDAESERRSNEILKVLQSAENGDVARRPNGVNEAALAVAQCAEPQKKQAIARLGAYLDSISELLFEEEQSLYREHAYLSERACLEAALSARHARGLKPFAARRLLTEIQDRVRETLRSSFDVVLAARQRTRLGSGRLTAAQVVCEALGRLDSRADAVAPLGRYLAFEADPSLAVRAGQALRRLGGDRARRLVQLALLHHGPDSAFGGRIRGVAARANVVLEEKSAAGFFRRGESRLHENDREGAVRDYSRVIAGSALDPCSSKPNEAVKKHPCTIPLAALAYSHRALARLALGDPKSALADAVRATELQPDSGTAWNDLASVRQGNGDLKGALADFARSLDRDPRDPAVWNNRASVRLALGDSAGALADCESGLELEPGDVRLWGTRARAHAACKDLSEALKDYDRAIELNPRESTSFFGRGNVHQARRDLQRAILDYDRALELEPGLVSAWANRGVVRQRRRNLVGAVADYTQALDLDPNHTGALRNRGIALQSQGKLREAIDDFSRLIELEPGVAMPWGARGFARARSSDPGAAGDLQKFLSLVPERHPMAAKARELLERL